MAKKFFYNKVYNTKRMIINAIIIGVCIIGVIICFVLVSNFQGEDNSTKGNVILKPEVTIEVNESFENDIFFSKIENFDVKDAEVNYSLDYDVSKVGKYDVKIIIDDESYNTVLNVVDTKIPELSLKNVEIENGKEYSVIDFVDNCTDNSKKECKISFLKDGKDIDGNTVDYSSFTKEGTYQVKIVAEDEAGNQAIKEAILKIGNPKTENNNPVTNTCKYGDNNYDTNNYLVAVDITTNKCAVSLDLYKDESSTKGINKLMETETTSIKKDVEALNLTGMLALNRKVTAVINTSGNGIVGYELKMTVTITNNGKSETIVEYKVNSNGKRVFITNPYKLAS